jgi:hypothetical protein
VVADARPAMLNGTPEPGAANREATNVAVQQLGERDAYTSISKVVRSSRTRYHRSTTPIRKVSGS